MASSFVAIVLVVFSWIVMHAAGYRGGYRAARRDVVTIGELVMRHYAKTCPDCESNLAGKSPYIEHGHGDGSIPPRPFLRQNKLTPPPLVGYSEREW